LPFGSRGGRACGGPLPTSPVDSRQGREDRPPCAGPTARRALEVYEVDDTGASTSVSRTVPGRRQRPERPAHQPASFSLSGTLRTVPHHHLNDSCIAPSAVDGAGCQQDCNGGTIAGQEIASTRVSRAASGLRCRAMTFGEDRVSGGPLPRMADHRSGANSPSGP